METTFAYIADPVNLEQLYSGFKLSFWSAASLSRVHLKMPPRFLGELSWESSPGRCRGRGLVVTGNLTRRHLEGLPRRFVLKRLQQAVKLAAARGARLVGLGPLSPFQEEAGLILSRFPGLALTTGRSMALAAAWEGLRKIFLLLDLEPEEAQVAVVGAASPRGALFSHFLARQGINYLSLLDPDQHRLDSLARLILRDTGVAGKVSTQVARVLSRADIVVFGGDSPAGLSGEEFKAGAVLCDLSDSHLFNGGGPLLREDLFIFDECALEIPQEIVLRWRCPLFPDRRVPPSLAETMILALEGRLESYSLGRKLRIGKVEEMQRLSHHYGFQASGFRFRGRDIPSVKIRRFQKRIQSMTRSFPN